MKTCSRIAFTFVIASMLLMLISCATFSDGAPMDSYGGSYDTMSPMSPDASPDKGYEDGSAEDSDADIPSDDSAEERPEENVYLPAGMITAGAHNDNTYYSDWLRLFAQGEEKNGKFYNYIYPDSDWGFNSLNRISVTVTCGDAFVAGATVDATDAQGNVLFSAVSDANGKAYLFTDSDSGKIRVTSGDGEAELTFDKENRDLAVNLDSCGEKRNVIEIMLVVDVTGSMGDEINFLKAELADVINRIAQNNSGAEIKLAMLFYRDKDDKVPFDYYDFTNVTNSVGMFVQQIALEKQSATGGGDYPEAVDQALDLAVNKQWSTGATTKIIFHVLDAPAHEGSEYATRLVNATKTAAAKGIRICPIICSGAAESTEYTMREAAIYTGGTFIFVTDDSGIGNSHHDPDLPNTTIELLNSLMVRLVNGYHTGDFGTPVYWKQDPNLNNK